MLLTTEFLLKLEHILQEENSESVQSRNKLQNMKLITFICHSLDIFPVTILRSGYISSFDWFNLISHQHKFKKHTPSYSQLVTIYRSCIAPNINLPNYSHLFAGINCSSQVLPFFQLDNHSLKNQRKKMMAIPVLIVNTKLQYGE